MEDKELIESVEKSLFEEDIEYIKTGLGDLDYILKGAEKPSLITIGGRPSMGKTAFLTTILINLLKQKKKCLFFSLDLSAQQLILRIISQLTEIDCYYLKTDKAMNLKNADKIYKVIGEIVDFDLKINDEHLDINSIKENIEKVKPDFVFIDYLQLIEIKSKKTRAETLEGVLIELKRIAKSNNCTIFMASSLSRALENRCCKRPMLSDLRESGGIENISDVVLFIYRDEYYDFSNPEYKNKAEIIVAKNKFGSCGVINLLFKKEIMKFSQRMRNVEEF